MAEAEVFINYRTGDGDEAAELIADRLCDRFGTEHVFKASRSIQPGQPFPLALIESARGSKVLLAVMGPEWARAPQLHEDDDWVRREIFAARDVGAVVVPVLKGRKTDRLVRGDLPPELRWLADVNSLRLDTHDSRADLDEIGDFLAELVPSLKAAQRSTADPASPGATVNTASNVTGPVVQSGEIIGNVTNVSGTYGPTQVGDGTQNNYFLSELRKKLERRSQPGDQLRWLQKRFVHPPGFDSAATALTELGTVVLDGPPGSGRTAAAKALLTESWSGQGAIHELEPQERDEESPFRLDPEYVGPDDRVWVDLTATEPQNWHDIQRDLPPLLARIHDCHARLVVIMPHGEDLRPEFRQYLKRIASPQPSGVFYHLLQAEGLARGDDLEPPGFLAGTPSMADIRRYVDYILDARDQSGGEGNLASWVASANERASIRDKQVAEALTRLRQAQQRALLLSAAMFHGAHADVIGNAANALQASLQHRNDAVLERLPLGKRLDEIGAETDATGHVRFAKDGYAAAVRSFFWQHFPEVRDAIATCVRAALDSKGLSEDEREVLARGFADQCLEQRYQVFWTDLVQHLTTGPRNLSDLSTAAAILEQGLNDEKYGRAFRQQIYQWSRESRTSDSLAEVIVAACQEMASTHPGEALVRLHHVARRHPRQVGARDALVELARAEPWLLQLLLTRLTDKNSKGTWTTDAYVFLDIADASLFTVRRPASQPLITQSQVPGQLTAGWSLAFIRLRSDEWVPAAHAWLRCAMETDKDRGTLVEVLVRSAAVHADVLATLYAMACRAEYRDAIGNLLIEKITHALGTDIPQHSP